MTYNIELADKPGKTGLYHVMVRLHQKGHKPARIQFVHEIERKYWNPEKDFGKWVRSSHLRAKSINNAIEADFLSVKTAVEAMLKTESFLSPRDCKLRYELGGESSAFKGLAEKAIQRPGVSNVTVTDHSFVLTGFFREMGEHLSLEHITPALLLSYRQRLQVRGLKNSTINQYISSLRVAYEAVQKNRGVSNREILTNSPFLEVDKLSAKSAPKGRLRESGLAAFKAGGYEFYRKARPRSGSKEMFNWLDWGRWCWLLSFYQAGMRVGDLLRSRYEWYELGSDGYPIRLRYQMQKNGRSISLKLTPEAIDHLKLVWKVGQAPGSYLLPFLDQKAAYAAYRTYEQIRAMPSEVAGVLQKVIAARTGQLNRAVKAVVTERGAEVVGGKLTNHSARHTVGDAAVRAMKAGKAVSLFDFQALFGHSSVRTSEIYKGELDDASLDSAVDAVFGD